MTAVAPPPNFSPLNKSAWGGSGGGGGQAMNGEDARGVFSGRKNLQRTNSSSSVSSTGSNSSTTTVATTASQSSGTPASSTGGGGGSGGSGGNSGNSGGSGGEVSQWPNTGGARKRPQPGKPWPAGKGDAQAEFSRPGGLTGGRPPQSNMGMNGLGGQAMPGSQNQSLSTVPMSMPRGNGEQMTSGQPVLYLLSLNGTFERKTIQVPFAPDSLRIGRQTNQKTVPTPLNGFFDSKVLSRQHAEIWADRAGKIWIRDVKSSNGTFVNGTRLSQENRESEPHELQTADHLELGIDIVSEDQKTVVHHKVAAKVEHAGFLSSSSNLLDVNFGDLDPANGTMMMPSQLANQMRARNGASVAANGRSMAGPGVMAAPPNMYRGHYVNPVTTESIVKRLQNEMRAARLQSTDLGRTGQFVHSLISKDDIKDQDKPESEQKQQPMVNGGVSFRSDPKARFSDPPAPPPQQPLPEKPDIPALKRGTTERPKSHPPNSSPTRDTVGQMLQLQEDLKNTRQALESRDAKVRELEDAIRQERQARENAEHLARRLEESATAAARAAEAAVAKMNGSAKVNGSDPLLDEAFDPPHETTSPTDVETPKSDVGKGLPEHVAAETTQAIAAEYQSRIDAMTAEIKDMKAHLDSWRQRCEKAEADRDADRMRLEDMVIQIRKDEEARQAAAKEAASAAAAAVAAAAAREKSRGRSNSRKQKTSSGSSNQEDSSASSSPSEDHSEAQRPRDAGDSSGDSPGGDAPKLSRDATLTQQLYHPSAAAQDQALAQSLPYASMLGVVLLGIGLMSYINGWQNAPKLER